MKKRVKPGTSKASAAKRRAIFIEEYLTNDENGTKAAIAAGFAESSAHVTASRLLKDPKIAKELKRRRAAVLEQAQKTTQLTRESVLKSLERAMNFDPRKLYHPDGKPKAVHELDDDIALAISTIDTREFETAGKKGAKIITRVAKIKGEARNQARAQAMKHLGLDRYEPPPPPPPSPEVDLIDAARRMAFTLAAGAAAVEQQKQARKPKKRSTAAA